VFGIFAFEKGKAFYFSSPFFTAQMTLFVLVGLLSIYPTVRFIKWRAETSQGRAPALSAHEYAWLRASLRAELALLLAVALCVGLGAGLLAGWLRARPGALAWLYRSSGLVLVGLGVKLAFERRP
jgi:uncharacterized membrane protein